MKQGGQQIDLTAIVLVGLAGKSQKNVPGHSHVIIEAPFQAHEVLHRSDALVHRAQLRLTQAFQSRLHAFHPTGGKQAYLVLLQIALGFDEDIEIAAVFGKRAEEILDIFHVDDIVDETKARRVVAAR